MYVLDTDTLSRWHAGHAGIQAHSDRFDPLLVVTSVITRVEILQGRFDFLLKAADGAQLLRAMDWLDRSERLLQKIRIVAINDATADEFDRLRKDKKLRKIGRADLLIASIALAHRATLVTRNLRDFGDIPGLQLENWTD